MLEKIYTIPVNEAIDAVIQNPAEGCPFCRLYRKLENDETEIILGASMMEPDVRIKTNEQGFCGRHFDMMFERNNRLGLALILESHLAQVREACEPGGLFGMKTSKIPEKLEKLENSCYVCGRINHSFGKMVENTIYLYETESDFRKKLSEVPYICLPHYRKLLVSASAHMNKKMIPDFQKAVAGIVNGYFDELRADVSHFCKKFDYRYENEPWGNSKDAVERAIKFLSCDRRTKPDKQK